MYYEIYKYKNWKYDSVLFLMMNRCVNDRGKKIMVE